MDASASESGNVVVDFPPSSVPQDDAGTNEGDTPLVVDTPSCKTESDDRIISDRMTFTKDCFNSMFTATECNATDDEGDRIAFMNCRLLKTLAEPDLVADDHVDVIDVNFVKQTIEFCRHSEDLASDHVITLSFQVSLDLTKLTKREDFLRNASQEDE